MITRTILSLVCAASFVACTHGAKPSPEKASCGHECTCPSSSCSCEGCNSHKGGEGCTCGDAHGAPAAANAGHSCH